MQLSGSLQTECTTRSQVFCCALLWLEWGAGNTASRARTHHCLPIAALALARSSARGESRRAQRMKRLRPATMAEMAPQHSPPDPAHTTMRIQAVREYVTY